MFAHLDSRIALGWLFLRHFRIWVEVISKQVKQVSLV